MTIENAQSTVDHWIKTYGVRYFSPLTNLGILMEEVGEMSRIMVREYGEQSYRAIKTKDELQQQQPLTEWPFNQPPHAFQQTQLDEQLQQAKESAAKPLPASRAENEDVKAKLADEMADVLWVLLCLANQTGVDLTKAMEKNFEKKTQRDAHRHKENPKLTGL